MNPFEMKVKEFVNDAQNVYRTCSPLLGFSSDKVNLYSLIEEKRRGRIPFEGTVERTDHTTISFEFTEWDTPFTIPQTIGNTGSMLSVLQVFIISYFLLPIYRFILDL